MWHERRARQMLLSNATKTTLLIDLRGDHEILEQKLKNFQQNHGELTVKLDVGNIWLVQQ